MVRISMDSFVKKFQPERYEMWKLGQDRAPHPEDDQSKLYKYKPKPPKPKPPSTVTSDDSTLLTEVKEEPSTPRWGYSNSIIEALQSLTPAQA